MKILFVHEVSYRNKVIFEMHEFPELLALRGHRVSFMEFDEGRRLWSKNLSPRTERINGRVHSAVTLDVWRPFQLGVPGIDRLLATLTVIPAIRKLMKSSGFDVVVLYAVPTYGIQVLLTSKAMRVPVIFRALDVSHKIRPSLFSPLIKLVEKFIYRNVDLLSANNPALAEYCQKLGKRELPTKVHNPPLDLGHFIEASRDSELRRSLGFRESDRVLVYMGSFFYFSGLKDAIREFAKISATQPGLRMLLIGGGEQDSELRQLATQLAVQESVTFTGFIGYHDLPRYLKVADIALNTLETNLVANVAFPNKVLQYMAAGLPVVSTKLKGLYQTFGEESGIYWSSNSVQVVQTAAYLARSSIEDLERISKQQLAAVSKLFEVESAVSEFEKSLLELAKESRWLMP